MSDNTARSNTLQIFRSASAAYSATTDPTGLNYGELAWNNGSSKLWIGKQTSSGSPGTITPYLLNPPASLTVVGLVELADVTETNAGTDAGRAVTPDGLNDWTGNAAITSVGTIGTGTWSGTALLAGKVPNLDDLTVGGDLAMGGNKITGLAAPTAANDAARKSDVDAAVQGLDVRDSVRVAHPTDYDITTSTSAFQIDGVTLVVDDRILLKAQTAGAENGVYKVEYTSPNWSIARAADANVAADLSPNMFYFVEEGTVNSDTGWVCTTNGTVTLTNMTFAQFSGTGSYTATDGLDIDGTAFGIADEGVTLAKMADVTANTVIGRLTDGGVPTLLSAANVLTMIGVVTGAQVNVKADWTQATSSHDAYVQNKPTLGTSAALSTATIADGGTGVATADQIHTFVTGFNYSTTVGDVTLAGTQTLTNKTIDCGTFIATS